MELLTLDANYQMANLIERYASLIWTERYATAGDFKLITTDVERMITLLPLESLVTLRESTVPMIVEDHKIEKPLNAAPFVTVTGRSFETVLERRAAVKSDVPGGPRVTWIESSTKESDVAYQAIRKILGDTSRASLPPQGLFTLPLQLPIMSPEDALSMVDLPIPADYSTATSKEYEVKPGQLYSTVLELIKINHHGIKSVRPIAGENKIAIEIYNGANLTDTVVFDAKFDQFEGATYLLSKQGSFNTGYVFGKTAFWEVDKTLSVPTGLDRRVLYVDASGEEGIDTDELAKTRGLVELYKHNATALFDGQISQQVAELYNRSGGYYLGDIIRLDGEYGLSENVRVAEFIRSDDNTGSKAYPTFEIITE